ncbi:hypothetical protein Aple_076840 [Acrocarpospora pleiomorpha]|uniref:DUF2397 domain-containing protein n=1 Tax=Acrocarpospora pleiomorpha TaxID=90975 RepID=A0A5M3XU77_9ACTN|nr:hypothetical protein [Acrocarpospora pleiomorpha]GES24785.1 hypothetical protein Aple_076840 [Acrocarpospora pleiomorpha]
MPEEIVPETLDAALTDEAVLVTYRRMFAALARDSGAVVDDPALVDIAETLFAAFAEAGEEWLTHEQMRHACRAYPADQFENRLRVLRGLGAVREVFPKPNQLRYRASFTSVVGLMFIRRMMDDGGQSEMHRLLALEDLNVADPRTTMEQARQSAYNLARAFRLWALELITLSTGTIEELREQAPKLWGTEEIARRAQSLHGTILGRWPALDRTCTDLRTAIYAYSDASRRAAGRLADSAGTTRNLTLLPAETWRTFAQTATRERLAAVLDGFAFDAAAPWHDPAAIAQAVDEAPRPAPIRPTPPRSPLPDPGPENSYAPVLTGLDRLTTVAEAALAGRSEVPLSEILTDRWPAIRRLLADLTAADLRSELPYRLRWSDTLTSHPEGHPSWLSHGTFERHPSDA